MRYIATNNLHRQDGHTSMYTVIICSFYSFLHE